MVFNVKCPAVISCAAGPKGVMSERMPLQLLFAL